MYKTQWQIKTEEGIVWLFCYHLGKRPYFPHYFLEENKTYKIEMIWNLELVTTFKIFLKCLFHKIETW